MPIINVTIGEVENSVKKELIEQLTKVSSDVTQIPEQSFTVLINELKDDNIGLGGKTLKEVKANMSS